MKQTPNYNFNKLEGPDTADLTQFNPNWDALDTNLKQLSDEHVAHKADDATHSKEWKPTEPAQSGNEYPLGLTRADVFSASGWPKTGTMLTNKVNDIRLFQYLHQHSSGPGSPDWGWSDFERLITDAGGTMTGGLSAPTFRRRNIGTAQYIHDHFEHNGVSRWRFVTEADADFAIYDYDDVGGSPRRTVNIEKDTGNLVIKGDVYTLNGSYYVHAYPGANAHYWLRDENGSNQGIFYWDRGNDWVIIRRYASDGASREGQITISATEVTFDFHKMYHEGNSGPFYKGTGSPEGVVTAPVGAIYQRTDGSAGTTLYVKEEATGNAGWEAK